MLSLKGKELMAQFKVGIVQRVKTELAKRDPSSSSFPVVIKPEDVLRSKPPRPASPLLGIAARGSVEPEVEDKVERLLDQLQQAIHDKLFGNRKEAEESANPFQTEIKELIRSGQAHGSSSTAAKDSISKSMQQFFIKSFLEKNYKQKLKSELIMQQIIALKGPKIQKKKNELYNQYWRERGKEQAAGQNGHGLTATDMLKTVCRNLDQDRGEDRQPTEAEIEEEEL